MNAAAEITADHAWTGTCYIDVMRPDPGHIHLEDIAVGLARESRYGARATCLFWSVAQHSLLCLHLAREDGVTNRQDLQQVLMHDAPEYIIRDMIRPVKRNLPDYAKLEARWWATVAKRFGFPAEMCPEVRHYDNLALAVEKRWLIRGTCGAWPGVPDNQGRRVPGYMLTEGLSFMAGEFSRQAEGLGLR